MLAFLNCLLLATVAPTVLYVDGALSCTSTSTCEESIRKGSECVGGICTNPFAEGCLRRVLGEDVFPKKRVCNSEDPPGSPYCVKGEIDYMEIRSGTSNWETPIFFNWIIQIIMSELLGVPATVENTQEDTISFYDPSAKFTFPNGGYNFGALEEAHRVGDCRETSKPCAHVWPEVWSGNKQVWTRLEDEGVIEPVDGNGMVGKLFWGIPAFVAEEYPEFMSHFGLSNQREKLARIFKRPTKWADYCAEVSPTGCETPDDYATRKPTKEEEMKYFSADGSYNGYFRDTDKNNCTLNPNSCSGHIIDGPPCDWEVSTEAQSFWNNISLDSDGDQKPNDGYSAFDMIDIYMAANATKSPVVLWWFRPDPLMQLFLGKEAEIQIVKLPEVTIECIENRPGNEERCSPDIAVRRGPKIGSCDDEAHALQKLMAKSLRENTEKITDARRSPAYDALKLIRVSDLSFDSMLTKWMNMGSSMDYYGGGYTQSVYDAREAVCSWVGENIDELKRFIPSTYPRTMQADNSFKQPYLYAAMALAAFVTILISVATYLVWHWRKRKVMIYAQVNFLFMILFGMVLVSIGSIVYCIMPSHFTCIMRVWFINLGYSLELIPLIVKVAAINKLFHEAKKMKRVTIRPKFLFSMVSMAVAVVVIFLVLWTTLDPPTKHADWVIVDGATNEDGGSVVKVDYTCASSNVAWEIVALSWMVLLLLCASALAFQTRNIRQEFNESKFLAFMIYSHFIFVSLRFLVFLLSGNVSGTTYAALMSYLLTLDAMVTMGIYFVPKFFKAATAESDYDPNLSMCSSYAQSSTGRWALGNSGQNLGGNGSNVSTSSAGRRLSTHSAAEDSVTANQNAHSAAEDSVTANQNGRERRRSLVRFADEVDSSAENIEETKQEVLSPER